MQIDGRSDDNHGSVKRQGSAPHTKDEGWEQSSDARHKSKNLTVPKTPRFNSDDRIQYRKQVLDPKKKMKEEELKRRKEEEERQRELEDAKQLAQYRKTLIHKPRPVPDFGNVFKPDFSRSLPPTKPVEIKFATDARLGPKHMSSPRSETSSPGGELYCNPQACADAYTASLRSPDEKASIGNNENRSPC